jgi:hypothetical protein
LVGSHTADDACLSIAYLTQLLHTYAMTILDCIGPEGQSRAASHGRHSRAAVYCPACHIALCCWRRVNCVCVCVLCIPCHCRSQAVEMKQVAEQDAERARFVVLKAEQVNTGHTGKGGSRPNRTAGFCTDSGVLTATQTALQAATQTRVQACVPSSSAERLEQHCLYCVSA